MKGLLAAALIALSATPALASTLTETKKDGAETYQVVCYTTEMGVRYCTRERVRY